MRTPLALAIVILAPLYELSIGNYVFLFSVLMPCAIITLILARIIPG